MENVKFIANQAIRTVVSLIDKFVYFKCDLIFWDDKCQKKKYFLNKICLKYFSFYGEFIELLPHIYMGLHVKYPLFLSYFNENWIFLKEF